MSINSASLQEFQSLLDESERVIVFTGAGISTESGIPDFRSPGGIWSRYQPIDFSEFLASEEMRRESWRRKIAVDKAVGVPEPNRGHRAIAELVRQGKVLHVITQNIDGLHQKSGVPDDVVIELHGNGTYAACLECGKRFELAPILSAFEREGLLPECDACSGIVKTATISFGQTMPEVPMALAHEATAACDLFMVVGSSLVVYPAAGYPALAKEYGAKLVILNRDPTPLDDVADLVVNAEIGATLGDVVGVP